MCGTCGARALRSARDFRARRVACLLVAAVVLIGSAVGLEAPPAGAVWNGTGSGQAPWSVRIAFGDGTLCTGSVISRHFVLTAAHCLNSSVVHVGGGDPKISAAIAWNGGWKCGSGGLDLALLRTSTDLSSLTSSPLPLAPTTAVEAAMQEAASHGWGVTYFGWGDSNNEANQITGHGCVGTLNPKYHPILPSAVQKTRDSAYDLEQGCSSDFSDIADALCFAQQSATTSRVQEGDSGGPWVAWYGGAWVQIAVHHGGAIPTSGKTDANGTSVAQARSSILGVVNAAGTEIMTEPSGTIVRDQTTGHSWLVESDGFRHAIPTGGDYLCFVNTYHDPIVNGKLFDIETIPEMIGSAATCSPGGGTGGGGGGGGGIPPVPSGAVLTISRGTSSGGKSAIEVNASGLTASSKYPVQCWQTTDPSGAGGSAVASFSMSTNGSGGWSGSGCSTSDAVYTNLRIGPNLIWSNTLAPPGPPVPSGAVLTISRGTSSGGRSPINLVASGLRGNTTFTVGCWQTSNSTGNGGSQAATFSMTTNGSGGWSGSGCSTADSVYSNLRIGPNLIWSNTLAPLGPPVPGGAVLTISRGTSSGGSSPINLVASRLRGNTTFTVGCWQTSNSTGNGGSQVASFSMTTNGSGAWSGSGCSTSDSAYTNLRIGPNLIWSNTLAPLGPPVPTGANLTISRGTSSGGSSPINLVASGLRGNTTFTVGCWQTSNSTGNGGSQVASFSMTTNGSGAWSGSGCSTSDSAYTNLRIGPNLIWSNTLAPLGPPVPAGANLTISRGASSSGNSAINLVASGLRGNTVFTVGCWQMTDSSGNGGAQVASFSITTNASGGWSGSGCSTSDSLYTNLRIGPNLIWSNTLAPVVRVAALTISKGPYAGGSSWWVALVVTAMNPNTTYMVQCWQTSNPSGNGGSRVASFSVTTDGSGDWSGTQTCVMSNAGYINLRIGPNTIWSNTIHF
jgi:hypothetical protein